MSRKKTNIKSLSLDLLDTEQHKLTLDCCFCLKQESGWEKITKEYTGCKIRNKAEYLHKINKIFQRLVFDYVLYAFSTITFFTQVPFYT